MVLTLCCGQRSVHRLNVIHEVLRVVVTGRFGKQLAVQPLGNQAAAALLEGDQCDAAVLRNGLVGAPLLATVDKRLGNFWNAQNILFLGACDRSTKSIIIITKAARQVFNVTDFIRLPRRH